MQKFNLVLCSLLLFSGCVQQQQKKGPVFGNIAYDIKDVWNAYSVEAFKYAAKEKGVDVIVLDSENSLEKSVALMEELIQKKVDAISIFPISPDQAATLVRMANKANIPITIENYPLNPKEGTFISSVAAQYDLIGAAAVNYMSEQWPGAKVLYVAGAKGAGVYEKYQEGIDRTLKEPQNKIKFVGIVHGDWETEKALNVTQNFIQTGKAFDVVFANNELMAQGVYRALKEANLHKTVKIVSTGGGVYGLDMIRKGELTATMSAPVSLQGLITFRNLYQHYKGKTPPSFEPLPIIPVDASNIEKAISWEVSPAAVEYIGGLD